jgi:hypothetical protein
MERFLMNWLFVRKWSSDCTLLLKMGIFYQKTWKNQKSEINLLCLWVYLREMWPFDYLFQGSKSCCSLDGIVDTSRSHYFVFFSIPINLFYFFFIIFYFSIHYYFIAFLILVSVVSLQPPCDTFFFFFFLMCTY